MSRVAPAGNIFHGVGGEIPSSAAAKLADRPPPLYTEDVAGKSGPPCYYCTSPVPFATFCPIECNLSVTSDRSYASSTSGSSLEFESCGSSDSSSKSRVFPSTRFFIAILLCFCFISLSISTSNMSVSMVCMIRKADSVIATINRESYNFADDEGLVLRSQRRDGKEDVTDSQEVLRLKRHSETALEFEIAKFNSTNLFSQLLGALEEIGLDNATLQYRPLAAKAPNISAATLHVPVTLCQLSHYRKHVAQLGDGRGLRVNKSRTAENKSRYVTVTIESCYKSGKLDWSSTDQGLVFAAQNAGSLLMLFTGAHADRLDSKWTIVCALLLLVFSNALLPALAHTSVWLAVAMRALTGFADALLQPSTSSMITRWFPPKERPFAIGLITGGRQIGTLLILPVAGFLCSRHDIANGWPAIFYLSALIGSVILIVWLLMSADKPSKHFCTSSIERFYIEKKISEENIGKRTQRRAVPWQQIVSCRPIYVGVAALICHEYPLVIMLQLLPKYINDVLKFPITTNGIVSALPIAVLFVSKTLSSSLSSLIGSQKRGRFVVGRTALAKIFNGIASLGLGVCIAIVPLLTSEDKKAMAIIVLCLANAFAGLHTPGVQTALLQLAPAYTGIVTGIAFGFVAIFSIINKVLSNYIVQSGSVAEWMIVFWIAAGVAVLPVVFFTAWGSAERQHWATNVASCPDLSSKVGPVQFDRRLSPPNLTDKTIM